MKNNYEKAMGELQEFALLSDEKKIIDNQMKEIKVELEDFAKSNRQLFEGDRLEHLMGDRILVLRFGTKSEVRTNEKKFSAKKFFTKFAHLCKVNLPVAGIKQAMDEPETRKILTGMGVSLENKEEFKIEV